MTQRTILTHGKRTDALPCPACQLPMVKITYPNAPWPARIVNGQRMERYLGMAECENSECEARGQLRDWKLIPMQDHTPLPLR